MINTKTIVVMLSLFTVIVGATGCASTHTERVVEREVPASGTTTVVR